MSLPSTQPDRRSAGNAETLYLDLLKRVLTNMIYEDPPLPSDWSPGTGFDPRNRRIGLDWPSVAHTMVGLERLDNVQHCVETVLADGVPGDLAETGVWRGGICVLMRAVLRAYGVRDRQVWVADSFRGMPPSGPGARPEDGDARLDAWNDVLAVPLETVRATFERYGLLDEQVRFLPGWFSESLPVAHRAAGRAAPGR
jgi:hypothetical protein